MTLLSLQRDFARGLVGRSTFVPNAAKNAAAGFSVYQSAYRRRLGDCLRDSFAMTRTYVGDDEFDQAGDRFIEAQPSESWTLSDYGRGFPEFLAAQYPINLEIAELARLEGAMRRAFDGVDAEPRTRDESGGDWDHAGFRFAPTFELLSATTNCAAIWAAIDSATELPAATPLVEPASICVWRKGLTPCFRTVSGRERQAIAIAVSGVTLGEFCRMLASPDDMDAVSDIGKLVALWLREEMLSGISDSQSRINCRD